MSVSKDMQRLRELLDVENNTEVLEAVQALRQPKPQPIMLVVAWTPGTPDLQATLNVLSDGRIPLPALSATLRAGLAVIDWQLAQRAQQLEAQLQEARAQEAKE